jgi:hypothetical protein
MPTFRYTSDPADFAASKPAKCDNRVRATVRLSPNLVLNGVLINESEGHADIALENGWEIEGVPKTSLEVVA